MIGVGGMLLLSDLIGSDVRAASGHVIGHLLDLTADAGTDRYPKVLRLAIGRRGKIRQLMAWEHVASFEHGSIELTVAQTDNPSRVATVLGASELLLGRDVLDTQIVDVAGKRLARVSELLLSRDDDTVRVRAVEVGAAGVLRRLGLDRLAERAPQRAVDWADLHLTSPRSRALQLSTPGSGLHRLEAHELAAVMAQLPAASAAHVLHSISSDAAANALSVSHPAVGARLLHAVSSDTATSIVNLLPPDDAVSLLRHLQSDAAEEMLSTVPSERAATLRRLLAHPVDTAGGLMNTNVRTASTAESVGSIRQRFLADAAPLGPPTVFVIDDDGKPLGSFEPIDVLTDRAQPRTVPSVPVGLPIDRVIDLFALQDHAALPVTDDHGRLVGVIGVDDVLEELLAERLPPKHRYGSIRRRAHGFR